MQVILMHEGSRCIGTEIREAETRGRAWEGRGFAYIYGHENRLKYSPADRYVSTAPHNSGLAHHL